MRKKRKMAEMMMSNDAQLLVVDDSYFHALFDEEAVFPISDEKYAEELQLQELFVAVTYSSPQSNPKSIPQINPNKNVASSSSHLASSHSTIASSSSIFCAICMDLKSPTEIFKSNCESHKFCIECMSKYIALTMQKQSISIDCPSSKCSISLDPQLCSSLVPKEVMDRWEDALCESSVLASQRVYCPFEDCSAMMVQDGLETVTQSECPNCWRLFCASCRVAWHAGFECREFKRRREKEKEKESDYVAVRLAESKKWRRCPSCKFYVERIDGCLHINCRCGYNFCYGCGSVYSKNHYCVVI